MARGHEIEQLKKEKNALLLCDPAERSRNLYRDRRL
jgi:hypothetical protein